MSKQPRTTTEQGADVEEPTERIRPMSRKVLARAVAAGMPQGARCSGRAWEQLEAQHAAAESPAEATALVALIRRSFCDGCPAFMTCARWAETERYTGLAAGGAYDKGSRQPAGWTVPRAGRQREAS